MLRQLARVMWQTGGETKDSLGLVGITNQVSLSAMREISMGMGFNDLIVGAPGADPNGYAEGQSYVVFGGPEIGNNGTLRLYDLDGSNGFALNGIGRGEGVGSSVSNAGDINGDGFDDLIIGAPANRYPNIDSAETSYVVFGGTEVGGNGTLELSSLNGSNGFALDGLAEYDYLGSSVSNAGDINGDGFDDLIIAAYGRSYVVFGGTELGSTGTLRLNDLDGSNGFALIGVGERDHSGRAVSNAGDINGDGFDDLIIGAPGADPRDHGFK